LWKQFSKISLTDRDKRTIKDAAIHPGSSNTKNEQAQPLGSPKRKLFTLIKDIHDAGLTTNNSHSQFKTLSKRLSQTEKLTDSNSISNLRRLAESQTMHSRYLNANIKPKSKEKLLTKVK
jgi:hypothetical protein